MPRMRRGGPGPGRAPRRRRRVRRRRVLLVGGLVAFGAYKMSQKDADRIEEHTGVPPEELEDDEVEQAMDDLGIEKQTVTEADQEAGAAGSEAAASPAATSSTMTQLDQIEKLAQLNEQGVLTDEEFAAKKKQILDL